MASMTDEEYQMYQKYGPNYREYMRFGYGRNQARARNQFNPGGGFYHTDPPQVKKVVENIMGTPAPEQGSPYLSDYLEEYEKTRQRVLQLEDLMNQNQFQYSQPDMSFEDFYNQYYGNYYGGGGGGDEGNNGVTEVTAPTNTTGTFTPATQLEGNVPVPDMPGWTVWNGANTMALVNWVNAKTGERITTPHGGFSPPSGKGWVIEEPKLEPLPTKDQPPTMLPRAQQTTAAYTQMAQNRAATPAPAPVSQERDNSYMAPASSAPAWNAPTPQPTLTQQQVVQLAANNANIVNTTQAAYKQVAANKKTVPTLNSYIPRYERS